MHGQDPFTRGPIAVGSSKMQREAEHRRILIVDDEEGFRDGLADLLGMEGYAVSVARDAVEAVRILPEIKPDVIPLDLRMPHLDGEAFLPGRGGVSLQALRGAAVAPLAGAGPAVGSTGRFSGGPDRRLRAEFPRPGSARPPPSRRC